MNSLYTIPIVCRPGSPNSVTNCWVATLTMMVSFGIRRIAQLPVQVGRENEEHHAFAPRCGLAARFNLRWINGGDLPAA
jgi:hypothetical protein